MWGLHTKWASSVIVSLLEQCESLGMRCGYIEFNEEAACHTEQGQTFVKRPTQMTEAASSLWCDGLTNYELCCGEVTPPMHHKYPRGQAPVCLVS